jgi:hypothetical protein
MMRWKVSLPLALLAAATASGFAFAEDAELAAPIEQCIRDNAAKTE